MPTRRDLLTQATAVGLALGGRMAYAKASQPSTRVTFEVPAGACDCHTHIIGDPAKFPFFPGRTYTPEPASPEEMAALHRALHIQRVVIVTPSFYGADNSATLYGMKARGSDARGIAVIDERTSAGGLQEMQRAGVRGVRLNLTTGGQNDPSIARRRFQSTLEQVRPLGWHIQMNTNLRVIAGISSLIEASGIPIVFDHFGGARASLTLTQPGWAELIDLVRSGKAYVKVSAPYTVSTAAPDYPDVAPFATALVAANPDRIIWGSDWPHTSVVPAGVTRALRLATEITPLGTIDDGRILNQFAVWVPDAATRKKILVDNPARLYGF